MKKQAKSLLTEITRELEWFETPAWNEMLAMTEPVLIKDCDGDCFGDDHNGSYNAGFGGNPEEAPEAITEPWDTLHEHIVLLAKQLREMDRMALLDCWNASYAGLQIMHVLNEPYAGVDERRFHPEEIRYDYLGVLDRLKRSAHVEV